MAEMRVDRSIEIDLSPEQAWEWLADIQSWPSWKPFIISSSYTSGGALRVGSKFKFKPKAGPVPVTLYTTITESKPPNRVAWGGGFPGLRAVHSFDFEKSGGGKTRITTKEAFTGFGVSLLNLVFSQKDLEKMHEAWLKAFQDRAAKK